MEVMIDILHGLKWMEVCFQSFCIVSTNTHKSLALVVGSLGNTLLPSLLLLLSNTNINDGLHHHRSAVDFVFITNDIRKECSKKL